MAVLLSHTGLPSNYQTVW